jgi:hypothetical protein
MKILEQGTLRYLLLDTAEIARNFQRRAARGTTVIVAEADPDRPGAFIYTEGFGLLTDGPVSVSYDPMKRVTIIPDRYRGSRTDVFASYVTYSRIAVAETLEEAGTLGLSDSMVAAADGTSAPADDVFDGTGTSIVAESKQQLDDFANAVSAAMESTPTQTTEATKVDAPTRPSAKKAQVSKPEEGSK